MQPVGGKGTSKCQAEWEDGVCRVILIGLGDYHLLDQFTLYSKSTTRTKLRMLTLPGLPSSATSLDRLSQRLSHLVLCLHTERSLHSSSTL